MTFAENMTHQRLNREIAQRPERWPAVTADRSREWWGEAEAQLRINAERLDRMIRVLNDLRPDREPAAVLDFAQRAATFAASYHSGRFSDGRIENPILRVAEGLICKGSGASARVVLMRPAAWTGFKPQQPMVLHVTTSLFSIGGHTRTICNWARMDATRSHTVVTLNQTERLDDVFEATVAPSNLTFLSLDPRANPIAKAAALRSISRGYDVVFLHHFGNDIVPTLAYAAADLPPVAVLNQADHQFWLGGTVADAVVNQRPIGMELCIRRRQIPFNLLLPVPLQRSSPKLSRNEARARLKIPDSRQILVTVGRPEKYLPWREISFFRTVEAILRECPDAHLYVVGVGPNNLAKPIAKDLSDRVHLVGAMSDPSLYQVAADVYLESFPFGSQTAFLEAAWAGVPGVLSYGPLVDLLGTSDTALAGVLRYPQDEAAYISQAVELLDNPNLRAELGEELRRRTDEMHTGESWAQQLEGVYQALERIQHRYQELPDSCPMAEELDLGLALWTSAATNTQKREAEPDQLERDEILTSAYRLKLDGHFGGALRVLRRGLSRVGVSHKWALVYYWMRVLAQSAHSRLTRRRPRLR